MTNEIKNTLKKVKCTTYDIHKEGYFHSYLDVDGEEYAIVKINNIVEILQLQYWSLQFFNI